MTQTGFSNYVYHVLAHMEDTTSRHQITLKKLTTKVLQAQEEYFDEIGDRTVEKVYTSHDVIGAIKNLTHRVLITKQKNKQGQIILKTKQ